MSATLQRRTRRTGRTDHGRDEATVADQVRRWQRSRDERAREALIDSFRPLAMSLANRYWSRNEPIEDLHQVALLGLLGAIDRFDPERGSRFESFAVPTITGELKRHFRDTGWSVHVPRGRQELAVRVDRAIRELQERDGHSPQVDAIARELGVGIDEVVEGLEVAGAHYAVSLEAPVAGDADGDAPVTTGDRLGRADDGYGLVEATASIQAATARLPFLERRALRLRLEHGTDTQAEIAERMGCSQMQVSRLLHRAADHVRELTDPATATTRASA